MRLSFPEREGLYLCGSKVKSHDHQTICWFSEKCLTKFCCILSGVGWPQGRKLANLHSGYFEQVPIKKWRGSLPRASSKVREEVNKITNATSKYWKLTKTYFFNLSLLPLLDVVF